MRGTLGAWALVAAIAAATQAPLLEDLVVTGTVNEARAAIARGADVNERDKDGVTLLMRAASAGRGEMVRLLLENKADATAKTSTGVNALMMASLGGYLPAVAPLLAAKVEANVQDQQGRTALMAAASSGDFATVDALLGAGADPKLTDADGGTALTYAAAEGFIRAVDAMQERGARPRPSDLMLAAGRCNAPVVQSFLAHGLDPNGADAPSPPLVVAANNNCVEAVEVLVGKGADLNRATRDGSTALIKATAAGHADVVKVLLAAGADRDVADSLGRTALMYASTGRHEEIAEMFRQGATPAISVTSAALKANEMMSREFTADGHNVSPPLDWSNVPADTKSIAVVCEDPDAGNPPPFVHWVIYNIPPTAKGLPENIPFTPNAPMPASIAGAVQGLSGFRRPIYRGPAPPPGKPHHYHFVVYALDIAALPAGLNRAELLDTVKGHILGQGELVAIYERKP